MRHTTEFGIPFSLWNWDDLDQTTRQLADQIEKSGRSYDRIVALANGGLTMVRFLGDRLGTNKISSVQLSFYQGVNDTKKEPQIIQPLTTDIAGQNILIFEDIVDTGATLEFALDYLRKHGARSVETASLVVKPHTTLHPEYMGLESKSWIIFPYETRETLVELWEKWRKEYGEEATRKALLAIGFFAQDFDRFCR